MPPPAVHPYVRSHLEGLSELGVVFLQLVPGEKRPTRNWDHFLNLHEQYGRCSRIDLADEWLSKGYGVGYLPSGKHWVVDCDHQSTIQRVQDCLRREGIEAPRCDTPSQGAHFSFRFPEGMDVSRLKHHVCHPKEDGEKVPWDFKLGTRTMLVAPGTQKPSGVYMPTGPWVPPPILDPRTLCPTLEPFREQSPFLVSERNFKARVRAGQEFVKRYAKPSISGQRGKGALYSATVHLVAYLRLDPAFAFYLLTKPQGKVMSWNDRCRAENGNSLPWSSGDLYRACEDAVNGVPGAGVKAWEEQQRQFGLRREFEVFWEEVLQSLDSSKNIHCGEFRRQFLEFAGIEDHDLSQKRFGDWVSQASKEHGVALQKFQRTHQRILHYRGVDADKLRIRLNLLSMTSHDNLRAA